MGPAEVEQIVSMIERAETPPTVLDLGSNDIGPRGTWLLAGMIRRSGLMSLQEIVLRDCIAVGRWEERNEECDPNGVQSLLEAVGEAARGQKLDIDLSFNKLGVEGAKATSESLRNWSHATSGVTLRLGYNWTGSEGAASLLSAMKRPNGTSKVPCLLEMDLRNNDIREEGGYPLAKAMETTAISKLRLKSNHLNRFGAKCIGSALRNCPCLTELSVPGNCLGAEGVCDICDGAQSCPKISAIDVHRNNCGDSGAECIARLIENHPCIERIRASNNSMRHGGSRIAQALLSKPSLLREIDLLRNSLVDAKEVVRAASEVGVRVLVGEDGPI